MRLTHRLVVTLKGLRDRVRAPDSNTHCAGVHSLELSYSSAFVHSVSLCSLQHGLHEDMHFVFLVLRMFPPGDLLS